MIRFEMPFAMWCGTCGELHPHGRRFNAVKSEVGKWHSSSIFSFRFKCNACFSYIEIRTDPEHSDFAVTSGGKRKAEATEEDATTRDLPKLNDSAERARLSDPFVRLEHVQDDRERGKVAIPHLEQIQEATERRYGDSVKNNRLLRRLHRGFRKEGEILQQEAKERGFGIELLPPSIEDETEARIAFALKQTSSANQTSETLLTEAEGQRHETKLVRQVNAARKSAAQNSIFPTSPNAPRAHANALIAKLQQKKVDMSIFAKRK